MKHGGWPRRWDGPSPDRGADARQQLPQRERLDHVVVGAELQPVDQVLLLAASGQNQHRDGGLTAQLAQHLEPVHAGKHQIEDDQVEPIVFTMGHVEPSFAVAGSQDAVAGPNEVVGNGATEDGVVFDDEDGRLFCTRAAGGGSPLCRGNRRGSQRRDAIGHALRIPASL